jgi:PAS domain S-box-containing protein
MPISDSDHRFHRALIRAILTGSGVLLVVLAFAFTLIYEPLVDHLLARDAQAWLGYHERTIGKRLASGDIADLDKDMPALVAARNIAGLVLFDAKGKVLYSTLNPGSTGGDAMLPAANPHLLVFRSALPDGQARLWLIMDRRSSAAMVLSAAAGTAGLMLLLLAVILLSVQLTLRRRGSAGQAVPQPQQASPPVAAEMPAWPHAPAGDDGLIPSAPEALTPTLDCQKILDRMPSCLWWADGTLRYQQISERASALFGMGPQALAKQPLWIWLADQEQSQINRDKLDQAVKSGDQTLHLAYLAMLSDRAQPRWLGEHINIQYDSDGKVLGLYGISSDITRRRQQEKTVQVHIERARRMETVGTLVGGIAHEFNNILAGIVGNIFLLRQGQGDNPKAQDRLDRVDMLIRKASSMIEQLLAFARKSQAQPGKFSLKANLEEILRILEPQLKSQAKIVTDLHSDAGVLANRTQIQQALTHMIDNADRALLSTPDPTIHVSLNEFEANGTFLEHHPEVASQHLLHLMLADNGEGIDPAIIDHIFEPFFTTREVGEGTGLGLSMVYGMVRHLGGAIMVDSEPGAGATFHLYFPRAEAISIEEDASGHVYYGKGETILIVEDEPIMRKVAVEVLQKLGYRIIEAVDGPDALREFEAHKDEIRLVMADLIMPIMGGLKVASTIRKAAPDMPVLFITAHDLTDSVGPELSFPNSDLISKPFPISALSTCLHRLLGGQAAPAA